MIKSIIPLDEVPQYYMHLTQEQADWVVNRNKILEIFAKQVRYKKSGDNYTLHDYFILWGLLQKKFK